MSSLITAVIGKVCIMKLNTNAGPRTNCNILRRGGTIPDRGGRFCIGATRVWMSRLGIIGGAKFYNV